MMMCYVKTQHELILLFCLLFCCYSVNFVFTNITAQQEAKITLTLPVAGPTLQKVKR